MSWQALPSAKPPKTISLRPLRASGCLYKSGKDETKEKVGPVVGGRASLSPGVLTDLGSFVSRSQPRRQIQDPSKQPSNACLRK
ncbi:unnamed protein product [Rangifer tarandus platyrhynchus]|uniref:Uncharacterized protein n=2 Tax=Rangifer tarandus platyrhynchus TaxID=3082113 RepID=A0ACB0EPQ0_RANTA|nr:unnamed protein product [Rangifer tarandus platyrhynchus]CAI9702061.1 unnamed protein product [Rangifer tarandus platyrhynchus]